MTISRFKPSYIKGRKKRPVLRFVWNAFAVVAIVAFFFGPSYLAPELYNTAHPTGDQIRAARALICAAILAPFAVLFGLMWWQSRGAQGAWMRRRTEARLEDSSKRSVEP
jgi:hypothetical protein